MGRRKKVHIVVKNTPFQILLALSGNMFADSIIDFNLLTLEANLLYDSPDEKAVGFINTIPLDYSARVDSADPTKCVVDVTIKILSSQHEDSLFKLRIRAMEPQSKYVFSEVVSSPIQVISKPEVIKKKNQPRGKKRTRDEKIFDVLSRIESRIENQQKSLDDLHIKEPAISQTGTNSAEDELDLALKKLISALENIQPQERSAIIRQVFCRNSHDFCSRITESASLLLTENPFYTSSGVSEVPQSDHIYNENQIDLDSFCKTLFDL